MQRVERGYVREADDRENLLAVRWWYVAPRETGVFALGGRVRTGPKRRWKRVLNG